MFDAVDDEADHKGKRKVSRYWLIVERARLIFFQIQMWTSRLLDGCATREQGCFSLHLLAELGTAEQKI